MTENHRQKPVVFYEKDEIFRGRNSLSQLR